MKEVVLEESDVAKALVDYISSSLIANFVLGASSRNALVKSVQFSFFRFFLGVFALEKRKYLNNILPEITLSLITGPLKSLTYQAS